MAAKSFSESVEAFQKKVRAREREIFVRSAMEVHRSVQLGSELTGSPGQPVDTGALRASWQLGFGAVPAFPLNDASRKKVGDSNFVAQGLSVAFTDLLVKASHANAAYIVTNMKYARRIEDGIGRGGAMTLHSAVGGFHSIALTRAGWPAIVAFVTRQVRRGS